MTVDILIGDARKRMQAVLDGREHWCVEHGDALLAKALKALGVDP